MITSIKLANFKIAQLKQELAAAQATIAEMREELAKQEPVAWMNPHGGVLQRLDTGIERETYTIPLYAAPVVQPDMVMVPTALLVAAKEVLRISDRKHDAWDLLKELIAAAEGGT